MAEGLACPGGYPARGNDRRPGCRAGAWGHAQDPPRDRAPPAGAAAPQLKIKRTRTGGIWVAVGFFAVILLLLLIFILQNGTQVSVSYLGMHGHLPLGVALLLAAVCGVLLVVLAGTARIGQLRARPAAPPRRRQARQGRRPRTSRPAR